MVSSKFILGFLIFILVVHIFASIYHWYWTYPWLDMPMHFFAGFWLAMFYFWFMARINANQKRILLIIIGCLGFVALMGVLWEFFEFLCDVFIAAKGYLEVSQRGVGDTMADLFFDLLGGLVFISVFKKRLS
jgi:hypothetical protein